MADNIRALSSRLDKEERVAEYRTNALRKAIQDMTEQQVAHTAVSHSTSLLATAVSHSTSLLATAVSHSTATAHVSFRVSQIIYENMLCDVCIT